MDNCSKGARDRAALLACVFVVALVLAGALRAGVARAGQYVTFVCHDNAGAVMPADLLSAQVSGSFSPSYFHMSNTCAGGDQGSVNANVGGCTGCYFGSLGVFYALAPPTGVSLAAYEVRYSQVARGCDLVGGRCSGGQGENFAIDSEHAAPNFAFHSDGPVFGGPYSLAASNLHASYLQFFSGCDVTYGACLASNTLAALYLTSLTAVLDDHSIPVVVAAGGPLISGQTVSGTEGASYTAQDSGGGIYSEHAYVDGNLVLDQPVDSNNGRCVDHGTVPGVRSFGYVQPCKQTVHASMSLDSTQWSDGPHRLKLDVEDAAGDRATVFDGSVTSANSAAARRAEAAAGRGGPCTPEATGTLATHGRGKAILSARLTCGGSPLGSVPALLQDDRGLRRQLTTDSAGRFRIVTGNTHGHFSVTVAGTTVPVAAELHAITLRISPGETTNHHAMRWRGRVSGGYRAMKLLLEVRKGRGWDIFDQTSTDSAGRYRYRYTFRSTTGTVRYTFRVVARDGSAVSPSRSIVVRG